MNRPTRPAPPPLEANDQLVTGSIAVGWAVALVVLLLARDSLAAADRWWIWTCATGFAVGVFGFCYVPVLKRSRARTAQRRAARLDSQSLASGGTLAPGEGPARGTLAAGEDPASGGDPAPGNGPSTGGNPAAGEDPASGGDPAPGKGPSTGGNPAPGEDPASGGEPAARHRDG